MTFGPIRVSDIRRGNLCETRRSRVRGNLISEADGAVPKSVVLAHTP